MKSEKRVNQKVLVTGASGYVGLHCVKELLEQGYSIGPLLRMPYANERLELCEANLLNQDDWPEAISGCTFILHVASPWPIVADKSTITIAVNGTYNVLHAAAACNTVKKVVITSSCSAINDGWSNDGHVFDESYWSDLESSRIEDYARSKTLAEKAAWNYWTSIEHGNKFDLTILNPTFITGPVLSNVKHGSATIISRMMDYRTFLAAPKASLGVVDVRDVARAHVDALSNPKTNGQRILITSQPSVWFSDWRKWLQEEFGNKGYHITPIVAPNWLVKIYSKTGFDEQAKALIHRIGPELKFDNSKVKCRQ
ncbi:hypothetical protein WR25_03317 [Diploscapter pachys]|uniref:NAD-dependent epimerase/dehydratase domain-containing protein n=1 Tax=Diploscapter pachys TaxID=2018661 RepID=A0A2A2L3L3_9BILA|nr:hypothetical protein WR25_03317 [Diploscapter pachys]